MSEKLFEDDEFYMERFQCDCLSPQHCVDVYLELADKGRRVVQCGFDISMTGKAPFWFRVKGALNYIVGKQLEHVDYIWRDEDIPRVVAVLKRAIGDK